MKKFIFSLILSVLFMAGLPDLPAQTVSYPRRLALIIGNGRYKAGMELRNTVNDARSMGHTLQTLGFDVLQHENLTMEDLKKAIIDYGTRLKGYDVGLFYYAGHGIQYHGRNYMVPIEAQMENEDQIDITCLPAEHVLTFMGIAETKVNIVILDACRNNPFERSWSRTTSGTGLALMEAPTGTLIAYATAPGSTASDGTGDNGLYTSAILNHIGNESLTIEQVFKRVRTEVEEKSDKRQSPWESTSLSGDDLFVARGFRNSTARSRITVMSADPSDRLEAEKLYQSGVQSFGKKLFNDALYDLTRSLELNPYSAETQYSMGMLHAEMGLTEQALADLTRCIALKPEMHLAYFRRGSIYFRQEKFHKAADDFRMASQFAPGSFEYRNFLGSSWYKVRAYDRAVTVLSDALAINPENASTRYLRGMSFYKLNEFSKAIDDFSKVIEVQPENNDAVLYNALAMSRAQPGSAIQTLTKALEMRPDPRAFCERGILLLKQKDYVNAANDLNSAITLDNNFARAIFWKGRWFYETGSPREALKALDLAVALDSSYAEVLAWRGFISAFPSILAADYAPPKGSVTSAARPNGISPALSDLNRSLVLQPDEPEFLLLRGKVLLAAGDPAAASADLQRIITLKKENAEVWLILGRIRLAQGDFAKASIDLTKSLKSDPENPAPYFWRAECSVQMKFLEQAKADLDKVLMLDSTYRNALLRHGDVMLLQGKSVEALNDYSRGLNLGSSDVIEALLRRGECLLSMGRLDEALRDADWIIYYSGPDRPARAFGLFLSGRVYRARGERYKALDAFREAARLVPENAEFKAAFESFR
ncbi:MAG: caspase family protein [Bacteroidota bacterium]